VTDADPTPAVRAGGLALIGLLTVLLGLWGAFLIPFRIASVLVPLSWVVALVGNTALGVAAGRLGGKPAIVVAGGLWLALAFVLGGRRPEGDLIVTGSTIGLGFLLLGAVGSALALGLQITRSRD